MAKGRGPTRMDKRREAEAVEAKEREESQETTEEEVDEEIEVDPDAEVEAEVEAEAEDGDGDDDDSPKKKKKKVTKKAAVAKVKKPAVKRTRTAKEVRRRAVWVVYDNASKEIEEFPFSQKADAEALLARKIQEKEGKATFYLNLVKKEIKDKE